VYAVAGAWLLAHLPFLAPALEDIDSMNFALGLHHYDPALHQPHPPGYPVFIAAGRVALAMIHRVAPGLSYVRADALALAIWSAIGGTLAIVAAAYLFHELAMAGLTSPALRQTLTSLAARQTPTSPAARQTLRSPAPRQPLTSSAPSQAPTKW
jgi:hypothetical protein